MASSRLWNTAAQAWRNIARATPTSCWRTIRSDPPREASKNYMPGKVPGPEISSMPRNMVSTALQTALNA
eukprot:1348027-Pyramimonas_sp.AAC.1